MKYRELGRDSQGDICFRVAPEDAPKVRAAGEMYDALRGVQQFILRHHNIKDSYHEQNIMACAIAKAEGRTP